MKCPVSDFMCNNHLVVPELLQCGQADAVKGHMFSTFHYKCTGNVHDMYIPKQKFKMKNIQELVQNKGNIKRGPISLIPYETVRQYVLRFTVIRGVIFK